MKECKVSCQYTSHESFSFAREGDIVKIVVSYIRPTGQFVDQVYRLSLERFLAWGLAAQLEANKPRSQLTFHDGARLSLMYADNSETTFIGFKPPDNALKGIYFSDEARAETLQWLQDLQGGVEVEDLAPQIPFFGLGS